MAREYAGDTSRAGAARTRGIENSPSNRAAAKATLRSKCLSCAAESAMMRASKGTRPPLHHHHRPPSRKSQTL
jgi:hypothetical protein